MRLEGIHHVTCITGDAPGNVDFYTRVLGLRLVKKTVNQDDPTVYHLFYADEAGSPGADLTFFEYPGARRGRAGDGMVHTIDVPARLRRGARASGRHDSTLPVSGVHRGRTTSLRFDDPEGLGLELAVVDVPDAPLVAAHPEIPAELAIQGFHGGARVRDEPGAEHLAPRGDDGLRPARRPHLGAAGRRARRPVRVRPAAGERAWRPGRRNRPPRRLVVADGGDHAAGSERVAAIGLRPTPPIDRFWFRSVYFREPSGVLFELATLGPGFAIDEDPEHLGERLILPPAFEHLREPRRAGPDAPSRSARVMAPLALLDHRVRPAAGEPEGALVLVHGRGADENDLFGLLDALDPERRLLGVTPGGPLVAAAGRAALVPARRASRHPSRRPSTPASTFSPASSTRCRCRSTASCSAASRRAA